MRQSQLRAGDERARRHLGRHVAARDIAVPRLGLVVEPRRGARAGAREPVQRHPGQELVVAPGVGVGPGVQFLVEEGEEEGGGVGEGVGEGLGLGGGERGVGDFVALEGRGAGEAGFGFGVVGEEGVGDLEGDEGMFD